MPQQLVHQRSIQNLDQVLGFDDCAAIRTLCGPGQFDHQAQRQLADVAAQLGALALHARRAEAAAVGLA